jgi:hypothetical protein
VAGLPRGTSHGSHNNIETQRRATAIGEDNIRELVRGEAAHHHDPREANSMEKLVSGIEVTALVVIVGGLLLGNIWLLYSWH